jgi:peptidoglycan/LPS O-acetylase OafA/YrhL
MSGSIFPALWRSALVTLRVLWRLTRQLFHEATGAIFGLFAAWAAFAAWKQWKHRPALWLMGFAIAYAIMMAAYAFGSFRRAKRVR